MADISITEADVVKSAAGITINGTAGASVTAGQPVYQDSGDDNEYKPARANTLAAAAAVGVALHAAEDGQPLQILQKDPNFTVGGTLTVGEVYAVSDTAGGGAIAPIGDLTTGDFVTVLGVAKSTTLLNLDLAADLQAGAAIAS